MALGTKRRAKIELEANTKLLERSLDRAEKRLRSFGTEAEKYKAMGTIGLAMPGRAKKSAKAKKSASGRAGAFIGGFAGGLAGHAGGAALGFLGNVADDVMAVEKQLTRFEIAGKVSAATMAEFRSELVRVSNATGISRGEIVGAAQAYQAMTGDAQGAIAASKLFAEVSAGSGASMEDVAATAATLRKNLKIDPKDFRAAFDVLVKQGEIGAVEIADLAAKMSNITPQFSQFAGGASVQGMAELGAMMQVAKDGFGSADELATGFNGTMTQLVRNHKKLKAVGVNVIDPHTKKFRNLLDIVRDISKNEKLTQDGALLPILGEEKAVRAMGVLIRNLSEIDRIKNESLNSDQVAKNNALFQASSAGKLQRVMETLKNTVAETFTPERIEGFVNALTKVFELLAGIVGYVESLFSIPEDLTGITTTDMWEGKAGFAKVRLRNRLAGTDKLSPLQKHTRAEQLATDAAALISGPHSQLDADVAEAKFAAAQRLRDQSRGAGAGFNSKQFAADIAAALRENPPVVKLDDSTVNKELDKSTSHRQPSRSR